MVDKETEKTLLVHAFQIIVSTSSSIEFSNKYW